MNSEAAKILNLQFSPGTFVLGAKAILSNNAKRHMKDDIEKLEYIASKCNVSDEPLPAQNVVDQVYARFSRVYRHPETADFSSRELRILTYSMYRMKLAPMVQAMVYLLEKNWRNRYFNGLLFFVLSNWDDVSEECMLPVLDLMQKKLKAYNGKRDKYLILKHHVRFLSLNGPELLGITLRQQDKGQTRNTSLRTISSMVFGMSRDRLDLQFFSRVITSYFEKDALTKLSLMEEILTEHNYEVTPKRLIPAIVINAENNHRISEDQKETIHSLAVSLIGDPAVKSIWSLPKGTPEENENLAEAQEIINDWIKRKFITIFFEKCVHEPDRKAFWLKHADLVWDFDIFCTKSTKALLLQDSRLSTIVERKVEVLSDRTEKDESALGMYIGRYYMVEFSDMGSIHIYSEPIKHPSYFYQLKKPHMTVLQDFMLNFNEGKLPHVRGWEVTFERWLRNHSIL